MSLIKDKIPHIHAFSTSKAYQWDAPADLLAEYSQMEPPAAKVNAENTIDILDVIGEDFWGDGVSAASIVKALKGMSGDVTVRLNSPGGDMFEGLAIYNLLRAHSGTVKVEVLGIAASAASVIAMAADEIVMGKGTLMMVHNAWGMIVGNKNDMREAADIFDKFDGSMANLYAARTGLDQDTVRGYMDAETFFTAEEAVEAKFADSVSDDLSANAKMKSEDAAPILARRRVEAALAKAGVARKDRPGLIAQSATVGPRDATDPNAERDAGTFTQQMLDELKAALKR